MSKLEIPLISIVAPWPIGSYVLPGTVPEVSSIINAVVGSNKLISAALVLPPSTRSIAKTKCMILHLTAHCSENGIEMEDTWGFVTRAAPDELAKSIKSTGCKIAVLNGCSTEQFARRLHAILHDAWVIGTTNFVPNDTARRFTESFYTSLLAGNSPEDSFTTAKNECERGAPTSIYFILGGMERSIKFAEGKPSTNLFDCAKDRYTAATNVALANPFKIIANCFNSNTSAIININGVPGSGVTTFLKSIIARYNYHFEACHFVDLLDSPEQLVTAITRSSRLKTLLCCDNFQSLTADNKDLVISYLQGCARKQGWQVVVGTYWPLDAQISGSIISLHPLNFEDANQILRRSFPELTCCLPEPFFTADMVMTPQLLIEIANQIVSGISLEQISTRLSCGVPSISWSQAVKPFHYLPAFRIILLSVALSGGCVLVSAIRKSFFEAGRNAFPTGTSKSKMFDMSLRQLRSCGYLVFRDGKQRNGGQIEEIYSLADLRCAALGLWKNTSPSELTDILQGMIDEAKSIYHDNRLLPIIDSYWISHVAAEATERQMYRQVAELGKFLLDKHCNFRKSSPKECIIRLSTAVVLSAEEINDIDLLCQSALVCGEFFYRSGLWDTAEHYFSLTASRAKDPGDKLRSHRALGQIYYRKGKFKSALEEYLVADKFSEGTPGEFVATLRQHQAKSYYRLGMYDHALNSINEALQIHRNSGDIKSIIRTQHELARIIEARGRTLEAEELYQQCASLAIQEKYFSFLPAPLYQLFKLNFRKHIVKLDESFFKFEEAATKANDPLWNAYLEFSRAMLHIRNNKYGSASDHLQQAWKLATKHGFAQVYDDIRIFLADSNGQIDAKISNEEEDFVSAVAILFELSIAKSQKAIRYSKNPSRIIKATVEFLSESATRTLIWEDGQWNCDCELFCKSRVCSHVVAVSLMPKNPFRISAPEIPSF